MKNLVKCHWKIQGLFFCELLPFLLVCEVKSCVLLEASIVNPSIFCVFFFPAFNLGLGFFWLFLNIFFSTEEFIVYRMKNTVDVIVL